jgi:uncharacterized protein
MILAIDFDGTLCESMFPKIGRPIPSVINFCKRHKAAGDKLILWTNRTDATLEEAVAWCKEQGLEFDAINESLPESIEKYGTDPRKIAADYYIDDKNLLITDLEERNMITNDRQYRAFEFETNEMTIEGKAVAFDSPTLMAEIDGVQFYEVIDRNAFANTKMDDVVLVIDHKGKPAAKTRNGTLELNKTDSGLFIRADLSKNATGRELHEDIKNGFYDKMSFAFTVRKDAYEKETRTRRILEIDRLYDVSAVTFPAYEQTSINARSFYEAEAEVERRELAEREKKMKRLKLLLDIEQKG